MCAQLPCLISYTLVFLYLRCKSLKLNSQSEWSTNSDHNWRWRISITAVTSTDANTFWWCRISQHICFDISKLIDLIQVQSTNCQPCVSWPKEGDRYKQSEAERLTTLQRELCCWNLSPKTDNKIAFFLLDQQVTNPASVDGCFEIWSFIAAANVCCGPNANPLSSTKRQKSNHELQSRSMLWLVPTQTSLGNNMITKKLFEE